MKKKPVNPNVRKIVVTFKVNAEEMRFIIKQAHTHADGSVSELIRKSLKHFKN